nr:MAG TPA: hypothetical protein [Caudoviricetes sp.]
MGLKLFKLFVKYDFKQGYPIFGRKLHNGDSLQV